MPRSSNLIRRRERRLPAIEQFCTDRAGAVDANYRAMPHPALFWWKADRCARSAGNAIAPKARAEYQAQEERGGSWPSCLKSMRCSRRQTGAPNSGVVQSATLGGLVFCDWFSAAMLVFCPGEPRPQPSAHRRPPRNRGDLRRRPLSGAGAPWYATRIQRPGMARMDVEPLLRWSDLKLGAKKQFPERPNHGPQPSSSVRRLACRSPCARIGRPCREWL